MPLVERLVWASGASFLLGPILYLLVYAAVPTHRSEFPFLFWAAVVTAFAAPVVVLAASSRARALAAAATRPIARAGPAVGFVGAGLAGALGAVAPWVFPISDPACPPSRACVSYYETSLFLHRALWGFHLGYVAVFSTAAAARRRPKGSEAWSAVEAVSWLLATLALLVGLGGLVTLWLHDEWCFYNSWNCGVET